MTLKAQIWTGTKQGFTAAAMTCHGTLGVEFRVAPYTVIHILFRGEPTAPPTWENDVRIAVGYQQLIGVEYRFTFSRNPADWAEWVLKHS